MKDIISIGAVLLGLAALLLTAQAAAGLLTQGKPLFNTRPFNCRACLTFWVSVVILFGACIVLPGPLVLRDFIDALIFSFINYFYVHTKIEVYD